MDAMDIKDDKHPKILEDIVNANLLYKGFFLKNTDNESDPVAKIKRIMRSGKVWRIESAVSGEDTDARYNQVWDDRATLFPDPPFLLDVSTSFNGITQYCNMLNNADFNFERSDAFALSMWIKTTGTTIQSLIAKLAATGWGLRLQANGKLRMNFLGSSNSLVVDATTTALNDGSWHHAAVSYSGNSAESGLTFVVDNILQSKTTAVGGLSSSIQNGLDIKLGTREALDIFFGGNMVGVGVFNGELSLAKISELYHNGVPDNLNLHSESANLISWLRMGNSDTFPTIGDQSNSGFGIHNAAMVNMTASNFELDVPA